VWWGVQTVSRETLALGGRVVMFTLTYRPGANWGASQISSFIKWVTGKYGRAYVWVAELQKRGAIHYHVLTSIGEGEMWNKQEIAFEWYYGIVWVTDGIRKPMYIMKYLQKGYQKNGHRYPKGARIIGATGGARCLSDSERRRRISDRFPSWIQSGFDSREREEIGSLLFRGNGGFYYGGEFAINPYSVAELPNTDDIQVIMQLAYCGRLVYNNGGWVLPQS
jgi:hypothetical protein